MIDTATLAHRVVEHGGDAIEAMWNHGADILFAVSATDPFGDGAVARDPSLRPSQRQLQRAAAAAGARPGTLPGLGWDFFFSYTWISISPDDRWAVFPL